MNWKEILEKNIVFNGHLIEKVVAVEELNELAYELVLGLLKIQKSLTKDIRGISDLRNLSEEMADVEIMLEQMKLIFKNADLVDKHKVEKLERIKRNLDL